VSVKSHRLSQALFSAGLMIILLATMPPMALCQEDDETEEDQGVFAAQRSDTAMGKGGWFEFTIDGDEYRSEWGYADADLMQGGKRIKITLLSSPLGADFYPVLKIIALGKVGPVEELLGQSLRIQRIRLRLNPEEERQITGRGSGTVTLDKLGEGWLEGRYSLEFPGIKVEGNFKARFYQVAIEPASKQP
jgi:hypothetical protein